MTQRERPEINLMAAVLMPDHLHLIARPGSVSLVQWVGNWKSIATRAAWKVGQRGTIWQPSFHDRALRGEAEFEDAAAYLLPNPSVAGLVDDDEDWPHRWARWFGDEA
jgi:putative transposase